MQPPTFLLPLSLYLFLILSLSPSTSLVIASAAQPIAAHAKLHHLKARSPVIPPQQHQEAPPVGIVETQSLENKNEPESERKGDEPAWEFDNAMPATPEAVEDWERHGETDHPPVPEPERHQQEQQEEPHPPAEEDPKPEVKLEEPQKPLAEEKKKPKKSLYTWPFLKTDVLDCCPKYAYNCADRKPICVSLLLYLRCVFCEFTNRCLEQHDGQRAEV